MSLILSLATLLLATLGLVFRFVVPVTDKARVMYATVSQFAFAVYFAFNHEWFWAAVWVVLVYRDVRRPRSTDSDLLVVSALFLYGLGTVWLLDSMGLSKMYRNPFALLAAVLLVVVSVVWWTIVDVKKMDAASPRNR